MLSRGSSTMGRRAVTGRGIHSVTQYTAINKIRNAHCRNINFGCVAYKIKWERVATSFCMFVIILLVAIIRYRQKGQILKGH